jgi:light-regulated signal transduction histidine kinase (bacteriophytochrome)
MTKPTFDRRSLALEYAAALKLHLTTEGGEAALLSAYVLGRSAWSGGLGVLDMAMLHHEALKQVIACNDVAIDPDYMTRAGEFLAEGISSFEMALRGYEEANKNLTITNDSLNAVNREFQALNKELDGFTFSVSHDLRAPVRAFSGYVRMLSNDYSALLDDEGRRRLSILENEAHRMGQLIDDLLEFSKLGRQHMQSSPIDMSALAREVVDEERQHSNSADVVVHMGALPDAQGDRALIRHVWQNLVSNAIKYSSKTASPAITISGELVGIDAVYCVRDNGAGFNMKYADRLFGAFQRLHAATDFPGTGVGLAIVQRIIARHEGRVWADARVGEGAAFWFTLKRKQEDERT